MKEYSYTDIDWNKVSFHNDFRFTVRVTSGVARSFQQGGGGAKWGSEARYIREISESLCIKVEFLHIKCHRYTVGMCSGLDQGAILFLFYSPINRGGGNGPLVTP